MIPARDGAKLFTVILTPKGKAAPLPILLSRTPYGAAAEAGSPGVVTAAEELEKDGYVSRGDDRSVDFISRLFREAAGHFPRRRPGRPPTGSRRGLCGCSTARTVSLLFPDFVLPNRVEVARQPDRGIQVQLQRNRRHQRGARPFPDHLHQPQRVDPGVWPEPYDDGMALAVDGFDPEAVGGLTEGFRGWDGINTIVAAIRAAGERRFPSTATGMPCSKSISTYVASSGAFIGSVVRRNMSAGGSDHGSSRMPPSNDI